MQKRAKLLLLFAVLGLLSLFVVNFALAAPSEPANVVNHKTKECAKIWTGDECEICVPTGDWEILKGDCPEGYTQLDDYAPNSCSYSGDPISMCDYAKAKESATDPNTIIFLSGLVIVVLLSVFIIVFGKNKVVHD